MGFISCVVAGAVGYALGSGGHECGSSGGGGGHVDLSGVYGAIGENTRKIEKTNKRVDVCEKDISRNERQIEINTIAIMIDDKDKMKLATALYDMGERIEALTKKNAELRDENGTLKNRCYSLLRNLKDLYNELPKNGLRVFGWSIIKECVDSFEKRNMERMESIIEFSYKDRADLPDL